MSLISQETKIKIKVKAGKIWRWTKENGGLIFAGATGIAAWKGYRNSKRNSRAISCLKQRTEVIRDVVNENAKCQDADRKVIEMMNDNKRLFEESLHIITEGKAK